MKRRFSLVQALVSAAAVAVVMAGCNPVTEFRNIVEGGTKALSQEGAAYRSLMAAAPNRGEAAIGALSVWVGKLSNLKAVMADANKKLQGKKEEKIRANKDVQSALARFKSGVDGVLGRSYGEAALKLVPPWRLGEARGYAAQVPTLLNEISSYYAVVFATTNPFAGKTMTVDVIEDSAILDTYQPCVDKVASVARSQAKNSYCVSAARSACGHQIALGCVEEKMRGALVNNLCPEIKTVTYKILEGETFRPEAYVDSRTEELKDWRYGATVTEPNPDRAYGTFCPGSYNADARAVTSSTMCGFGAKARIYGYNEERHVRVEIEGVRHQDDPRKDVIVDIYAEGSFVGTRVIRPDYGWQNNVYAFDINERAFQLNSLVKLQFRDLMQVNVVDPQTGLSQTRRVHWIVEAQIKGEDVPFIRKREVSLTKYTPNTWVAGIVSSCVSSTPVLK